ncbi:MAG: energy-coupling factor ABC transporter ATP-binding protein, partial [Microcystaceae cyanobacterium]
KQIRSQVGLVFQNPDDQLFMPTVAEDIGFGLKNLGIGEPVLKERVAQSLGDVNLNPQLYGPRNPDHLSGGEKKRVAIAGVLAMRPEILVLDEPSAQLDPASRRELINLLRTLPITQLIATHDLDLVLDLCDRTLVLSQGHLVYDGPTMRLMSDSHFLTTHRLESPLSMQRPDRQNGDRLLNKF